MRPIVSAAFDRSSVSQCVKQLARLILAHDRPAGHRLPPQQALRRMLGTSNDTLSAAMARLVEMGVVTRKPLVGTVVADPHAAEGINWSVGLATFVEGGPSAFFSDLHHRLLVALSRAHCRGMTYYRGEHPHWPSRVSDFPGLNEDITNRHLDGLLVLAHMHPADWRRIVREGIPVVQVGPSSCPPLCGVTIDAAVFEREAGETLAHHGCVRRALVTTLAAAGDGRGMHGSAFQEILPQQPGIEEGRRTAERLLARPRHRRPDGLAVTDDYAAMGLTRVLAENRAYRPRVAVMTNRQLPLEFSLPVTRFELDSDELVAQSVALLKARITGRIVKERVQTVAPRLARLG